MKDLNIRSIILDTKASSFEKVILKTINGVREFKNGSRPDIPQEIEFTICDLKIQEGGLFEGTYIPSSDESNAQKLNPKDRKVTGIIMTTVTGIPCIISKIVITESLQRALDDDDWWRGST